MSRRLIVFLRRTWRFIARTHHRRSPAATAAAPIEGREWQAICGVPPA